MPKLRLTRAGFTRAITTLKREIDALDSQAISEYRAGDRDMGEIFASRADALASIREALIRAKPTSGERALAEVELPGEHVATVRDAATINPEGWRYAS